MGLKGRHQENFRSGLVTEKYMLLFVAVIPICIEKYISHLFLTIAVTRFNSIPNEHMTREIRRKMAAEQSRLLEGKAVLVTGASAGIGIANKYSG